jgi:hypothetical protein
MDDPPYLSRRCGDQIGVKQVVAVAFQISRSAIPKRGLNFPRCEP